MELLRASPGQGGSGRPQAPFPCSSVDSSEYFENFQLLRSAFAEYRMLAPKDSRARAAFGGAPGLPRGVLRHGISRMA
jgi:hypothetical protein